MQNNNKPNKKEQPPTKNQSRVLPIVLFSILAGVLIIAMAAVQHHQARIITQLIDNHWVNYFFDSDDLFFGDESYDYDEFYDDWFSDEYPRHDSAPFEWDEFAQPDDINDYLARYTGDVSSREIQRILSGCVTEYDIESVFLYSSGNQDLAVHIVLTPHSAADSARAQSFFKNSINRPESIDIHEQIAQSIKDDIKEKIGADAPTIAFEYFTDDYELLQELAF